MSQSRLNATVVSIQAMPAIVAERLLSSLAAEGVTGSLTATDASFEVEVRGAPDVSLVQRVAAALDRVVLSEARSIVPEQVGPTSFVLRPAAG